MEIVTTQGKMKKMLATLKETVGSYIKNPEVEQLSEVDMLRIQLDDALEQLSIAESNFDNALPEFLDIANEELTIANNKVNVIIKKIKKLNP